MQLTLQYFEHYLFLTSSFFDSLLKKLSSDSSNLNHLLIIIINTLYNVFFSIITGVFLSIPMFALTITITKTHNLPTNILLPSVPLILFVFFSCIVLLNGKDQAFSLPWSICVFYGMFIAAKPKQSFIKTISFLLSVTFVLGIILTVPASFIFHPSGKNTYSVLFASTFSISFITTVLLYSYGTLDNLTRVRRQFVLWFIILLGVLIFSAFQLKINLEQPFTDKIHISSILLLLAFIYSMITVIDKGIELFKLLLNEHSNDMKELWDDYTSKYGLDILISKIIRGKYRVLLFVKCLKLLWSVRAKGFIIKYSFVGVGYIFLSVLLIYKSPIISFCISNQLEKNLIIPNEQVLHVFILFGSIAFLFGKLSPFAISKIQFGQ